MPNNIPRNHHYVCEFLLKNFADSAGILWIYDSQLGTYRDGNTRSAGFERDLYALRLVGKDRDFESLEKALERQIDTPGAVAIRKLLIQEECTAVERESFLGFVAAQMIRTPAYFDRFRAMAAPVMQETLERMAKFEPKFREGLRKDMLEAGASNDEVDGVLQAVADGRYRAGPTQDWLVTSAVRLIPTIHSELQQMQWTFLTVPDGDPDLLIGDCPVMLAEPSADDQPQKTLGLRNRNIELVMPLGRRMVAIARHDGPDSFGELMKGSADVINSRTLAYARRFVFAPSQSDALLADIVKLRGTGPQVRVRRIQAGKRLIIVSEFGE